MAWERQRERIHREWRADWERTHSFLGAETWEYLFTGGKEIRARLFCDLWEYLAPDQPCVAELGFVVECLHAASLIIDDCPYMDHAATRRGKPTLHTRYPLPVVAHLCYDVLHMARRIWRQHRPSGIPAEEWNEWMRGCLQRLIVGQWCDMERKGTVYDLASLKTGVLFECVTGTVARCIGLDPTFWGRWGNHVGVLFQWTDDWKDREEDQAAGSRNAFLEGPAAETLNHYRAIWKGVQQGAGATWFHRPFGAYLHSYFDWCPVDSSHAPSLAPSLAPSHAPSLAPSLAHLPALFSALPETNGTPANDLIVLMYQLTAAAQDGDEPRTLWDQPWEEWTVEEQWVEEWERRTGWAIRPVMERLQAAYRSHASTDAYRRIVEEFARERK